MIEKELVTIIASQNTLIEFLLDYARRVATGQVVRQDVEFLKEIRESLKQSKKLVEGFKND